MNSIPRNLALVLSLSLVAASAFASNPSGEKSPGPCKKIVSACEAAGFVKGGHKKNGNGVFKDCLNKILAGEAVANVTVPADEVAACKEKKAKRQAKKNGAPATTHAGT